MTEGPHVQVSSHSHYSYSHASHVPTLAYLQHKRTYYRHGSLYQQMLMFLHCPLAAAAQVSFHGEELADDQQLSGAGISSTCRPTIQVGGRAALCRV